MNRSQKNFWQGALNRVLRETTGKQLNSENTKPQKLYTKIFGYDLLFKNKTRREKEHFQNDKVRTSENLFFHKSNKTLAKIVFNFFRILKIDQELVTVHGAFIQEKWLHLGKKRKLWCLHLPYSHPPLLSSLVALKINSPYHSSCGNKQPSTAKGDRMDLESSQGTYP